MSLTIIPGESLKDKKLQLKIFLNHLRHVEFCMVDIKRTSEKIGLENVTETIQKCHTDIRDILKIVKETTKKIDEPFKKPKLRVIENLEK